jgi:SAM-dependent methyltransferase
MKETELRALWDGEVGKYAERGSRDADFPLPADWLPRPGDKALDAGCGGGNYLAIYRRITPAVFGVDFSAAMTRAAARYGYTVQADVRRLPFRSDEFDYVSSYVVINHVLDSRAALEELARVARPGGRVLVVVPNWLSFLAPARTIMIKLGRYSLGPCRHYTPGMLRDEGAESGLNVSAVATIPKVPSATTPGRQIPSWIGYSLDHVLHAVVPSWGGDLAVLFEKRRR